jgi:hypothetical protein
MMTVQSRAFIVATSIRWFGAGTRMGRILCEIARRVSWNSYLLLFELDPARAHHLSNSNLPGIGAYTSTMGDAARRHLPNSREFDAHFRRNRGDSQEIHLHITDRM